MPSERETASPGVAAAASRRLLFLLFFVSGACGLIYEVLWLRSFTAAFGVTVYATSVVLAAFMGGLALGSACGGRLVERRGSPLVVYGLLELGIGCYALLMPVILGLLPVLYQTLFQGWLEHPGRMLAVRFLTSLLVLLVPTTLMGATLPVLCKLLAPEDALVGRQTAWLYAANTSGGVCGTLLAGFALLPALGVLQTTFVAASANLAVGALSLLLAYSQRRASGPGTMVPAAIRDPLGPSPAAAPRRQRGVLPLIAISGFAALAYEVVWTRILALITFNTVQAFTAMLATFLVGIALGGALYPRLLDRQRRPWAWFAGLQLGIGAYALVIPLLFGTLATYFYRYQLEGAAHGATTQGFLARQFLLAGLVMLPPTLLMGASLPLACRIYATGTGRRASAAGDVYSSNTLGAIAGSAFTGLIFVPVLGLKGALLLAVALNATAALAATWFAAPRPGRRAWSVAGVVPVALLLVAFHGQVDVTFTNVVRQDREILFHDEDVTGVVEVYEKDSYRYLAINRLHIEGSNRPQAVYLQRKQGYLPLLLHEDPRSVLEIGVGSGIGFTPVALDDRVERAEVVEISPGVVRAVSYFSKENHDVLAHPKVHVHIEDGRNYLLLTPNKYDLIILGLFTTYQSHVGYLFTQELYRLCRNRLRPGGMLWQWIALSELPLENLKVIISTLRSVYRHVYVWEKGAYVALLGADRPLVVDLARLRQRLARTCHADDLAHHELDDAYAFLTTFVMGPDRVPEFTEGAPLNTEDRLYIEFSDVNVFKAAFSGHYIAANLSALLERKTPVETIVKRLEKHDQQQLAVYFVARNHALRGVIAEARGQYGQAQRRFRLAARMNPKDDIARYALARYR